MSASAGDVSIDVIQKKILNDDNITVEADYFTVWVNPTIMNTATLLIKAGGTVRVLG